MKPVNAVLQICHSPGLHQVSSNIVTPITLHDVPPRIARAIENEDYWDFDIFELEAATQKR